MAVRLPRKTLTSRTFLVALFMQALLSACVHEAPDKSTPFKKVTQLSEFDGEYRNLAVQPPGSYGEVYLSAIIWGDKAGLDHSSITTVRVSNASRNAISVQALNGSRVEKEAMFVVGKDVQFESGRLILPSKGAMSAGEGGLGVGTERVALGLDLNGQGKYQREETGAVLAMFLVPIGVHQFYECSFPRVK